MDEDELMVQWFELVNAKNDLVRKEADLMYQQRQQELEVLHEELEYDLRCLMNKPGEMNYSKIFFFTWLYSRALNNVCNKKDIEQTCAVTQ